MTKRVSDTEAATTMDALLAQVEAGEEIEITRGGRLIARITPVYSPATMKGFLAGVARQAVSDDELIYNGAFDDWDPRFPDPDP